jgi:myosin heavy subunit
VADRLSHVLGIKSADFQKGLLKPRVKAGREWVTAMVTAQKVGAHGGIGRPHLTAAHSRT